MINTLAGAGDERNKEVVQVAVQALREQTTQNSQPAKLPCARTVKQICKRVALVTASTEDTTEPRQRAFFSRRDVVTFAAGVLGLEHDQHIVHFRLQLSTTLLSRPSSLSALTSLVLAWTSKAIRNSSLEKLFGAVAPRPPLRQKSFKYDLESTLF